MNRSIRNRIFAALAIGALLGATAEATIRPAAADAGSEVVRIRQAVESIAQSLSRCPR